MNWSRQPIHAKEFVKPISLIPALLLTEPQALPGYSHVALPFRFAPLLSNTTTSCPPGCATRNCQVYEKRHLDNWRTYSCVAFSSLFFRLYLPTGGQFHSRLLCTISPRICVRLPSTRSYETSLCHAATVAIPLRSIAVEYNSQSPVGRRGVIYL